MSPVEVSTTEVGKSLQARKADVRSLAAEHHLLRNALAPNLSISRFCCEFSVTVRKMIAVVWRTDWSSAVVSSRFFDAMHQSRKATWGRCAMIFLWQEARVMASATT